jgi:hypothetical protein
VIEFFQNPAKTLAGLLEDISDVTDHKVARLRNQIAHFPP